MAGQVKQKRAVCVCVWLGAGGGGGLLGRAGSTDAVAFFQTQNGELRNANGHDSYRCCFPTRNTVQVNKKRKKQLKPV